MVMLIVTLIIVQGLAFGLCRQLLLGRWWQMLGLLDDWRCRHLCNGCLGGQLLSGGLGDQIEVALNRLLLGNRLIRELLLAMLSWQLLLARLSWQLLLARLSWRLLKDRLSRVLLLARLSWLVLLARLSRQLLLARLNRDLLLAKLCWQVLLAGLSRVVRPERMLLIRMLLLVTLARWQPLNAGLCR
jgi:hypothetical protein